MAKKRINCPQCNKTLLYEKIAEIRYFPFCGEQCRLVDIDHWFSEDYKISDEPADNTHDEPEKPSGKCGRGARLDRGPVEGGPNRIKDIVGDADDEEGAGDRP